MTEPPSSHSTFAARQQPPLLNGHGPVPPSLYYAASTPTDPSGLDGPGDEEDDGEIICICAYNWDDGYTIQCETCNKWNHMECYYPNESDRPAPDQTHYCVECQPREVDARRASALQREKYTEQQREKGSKRPVSKAGRKKVKDSPHPLTTAPVANGWPLDKHSHLQSGRERKSASPRDQAPPAKRTKTTHRSSTASNTNNNTAAGGRKRNGSSLNQQRSQSQSPPPGTVCGPVIPMCTQEFLHLPETVRSHVETNTNIWNSIDVTNSLSNWLKDPEAVERDCQHKQMDVFKRWDGPFDEMPGKPEVCHQTRVDSNFTGNGDSITYPCLTVEQEISQHTFIGELLGHVGFKDEYMTDPDSRWESLRHCEPFVFFHPKLPIYIDAREEGSIYRYVRRSCRPNAEMQTIITDATTYHFCFMATKDIMPGEEITVGWEFDDRIRSIYAQRSSVNGEGWAPDVRDQIALWVSNVLANCGPCACSGQGCPMAFFDRRGQALPIQPGPASVTVLPPSSTPAPSKSAPKSRKRKTAHQVVPDEVLRNNSRSGSEVRKADQEDDMTDSRSVSGSYRGSASRDITPGTHYSALVPELSEREKKKLMREEEMFKKQEEDRNRQRKKRNSGGINPNIPGHHTSVCCHEIIDAAKHSLTNVPQKRLDNTAVGGYVDAGTVSRNSANSTRLPASSRRNGKQPASARASAKPSAKLPPKPVYKDMAVQCDMDMDEAAARPLVTPPKQKRYLSVTQRLLRRCASNNFKRKVESPAPDDNKVTLPPQGDTMDIDKDETPGPDAETAEVLPLSPISDKVKGLGAVGIVAPTLSPAFGNHDIEMKDGDEQEEQATSPSHHVLPPANPVTSSPTAERARPTSHPPMDPPPPPWPSEPNEAIEASSSSPILSRPVLNVSVPAPSEIPFSTSAGTVVQSPPALAHGTVPVPILQPTMSASLNPSPIARKKMSLSDYTKRNKAQRHESDSGVLSHRESSPAMSTVSADLLPRDGTLTGVSPAPESMPASSAEAVEKTLTALAEQNELALVDESSQPKPVAEGLEDGEVGSAGLNAAADLDGQVSVKARITNSVAPVAPMADMVPVMVKEPVTPAVAESLSNGTGSTLPAPTAPMSSS